MIITVWTTQEHIKPTNLSIRLNNKEDNKGRDMLRFYKESIKRWGNNNRLNNSEDKLKQNKERWEYKKTF